METITVQYVNAPKPGKKMGNVKTQDGRIFGVWPDKLSQFTPGGTYEVETDSREFNGKTLYNIKSAKAVSAPASNGAHAQVQDNSGVHWGGCLKVAGNVHQGNAVPASSIISFARELYAATPTEVTVQSTTDDTGEF